jgi:hypothetical protein
VTIPVEAQFAAATPEIVPYIALDRTATFAAPARKRPANWIASAMKPVPAAPAEMNAPRMMKGATVSAEISVIELQMPPSAMVRVPRK